MPAVTIIVIVVILVILAVAAAAASMRISRRKTEHDQYGPEYERLAQEVGSRRADAEFARRRQRVDGLGLTSLSAERRAAFIRQWDAAQEQFIDSPARSVGTADSLVRAAAAERGYQTDEDGQFLADLSVHHGRHLDGYRGARLTAGRSGQVTTEGRRRALLAYRALFFDLLEAPGGGDGRGAAADAAAGQAAPGEAKADQVPQRPAWKQVTQGMHWKTQRAERDDVAATRQ